MFFSIRTFNPHYFEYKKQVYRYSSCFGFSVQKDYADYRKITEYDVQYLKENGFNYFLADYHSGGFDEKNKNWKDFGAIEDEKGYVYIPFIDIDDAIRRKREYYKSQGYGAYDSIVFVKFVSLSDIEAFYKISSYIQIDGQNFPFSKPTEDIGYYQYYHMCPTYEYYKDKFYIKESELEPSQICFLEKKGFKLVDDIPESNWYDGGKFRVFALRFTDFDGFVIEKQNCDLNDFGKTSKPKLIGEMEVFYLDRRNPDPRVWEMLEKKYGLIEIYDF